jgi:predicted carbohydrate-binding protein with CBM5 and CBM33 domain
VVLAGAFDVSDEAGFNCAGCGQWNETSVDASAGRRQSYVEDCQVCCKPNVLKISWDEWDQTYRVESELES